MHVASDIVCLQIQIQIQNYTICRLKLLLLIFLELRNAKIYGLVEQKHLEDKEVLRPEDLNFCIS